MSRPSIVSVAISLAVSAVSLGVMACGRSGDLLPDDGGSDGTVGLDDGGSSADAGVIADAAHGEAAGDDDASAEDGQGGAGDATLPAVDAGVDAGADGAAPRDAAGASEGGDAGDAALAADAADAATFDAGPVVVAASVLQFHNHATRDGVYVDPLLTRANAAKMHLDATFHASVTGNVYAQALYVANGPGGNGAFLVATETNDVYALDETGAVVWHVNVGMYASRAEKCGNIMPLGITGTPVVDPARRTVYLDAARPGTNSTTMAEHEIHALSIDTGSELAGWPVPASTVTSGTTAFNPRPQNQRGALLVVGSTLYVPYGGHSGDCTDNAGDPYHGWIIGVPLDNPAAATGWETEAEQAGMWSVGGLASDGTNIFATTGNANDGQFCPTPPPMSPPAGWKQQEAVLRFQAGPVWSGTIADYFAPLDWPCLDNGDIDVGGSNPVLFDVDAGAPSHFVAALGKDGKIYLVDRTNLGGVGNDLASSVIMTGEIKMAPAAYTTANGTYVVGYGSAGGVGARCPAGESGNLVAVKVTPGTPPTVATAWCVDEQGQGSPIFTTSDGTNDALVWAIGAESSQVLHAWDADTGAVVFSGTDLTPGFHHFSTLIAVKGRLFASADGTLYAFTSQ